MENSGNKPSKETKPGGKADGAVWKSSGRATPRQFPGPREAVALLRVAVERGAYAELIAHAKASLEAEICGVLAGTVCEDDRGLFVHVEAVIRGSAASHGSTHVTFTQETWNGIHKCLEQDHPRLQMVGWYHSHPGFGVEFSELDLFIQKNFFPSPTQVALVIDPLSGAVAICLNTESGIQYLEHFWVDGREQPCQVPANRQARPTTPTPADSEVFRTLETRMSQLVQSLDDQRAAFYRFLMFIGAVVCIGVVACFGYTYYSQFRYRNEPPKVEQVVPIPIQIGDKKVLLGVGIVEWQVPEELNAISLALEREKRRADEKAAHDATNHPGTNDGKAVNQTNAPQKPPP